jgi:hypothetical protein
VQTITTAATHIDEVQVVTTTADRIPEVQIIQLVADEGQVFSGGAAFQVTLGTCARCTSVMMVVWVCTCSIHASGPRCHACFSPGLLPPTPPPHPPHPRAPIRCSRWLVHCPREADHRSVLRGVPHVVRLWAVAAGYRLRHGVH